LENPGFLLKKQFKIGYLLPYAAVWVGLNLFRSAWIALALYHAGILIAVFGGRGLPSFFPAQKGCRVKGLIAAIVLFSLTGPILYYLYPHVVSSPDCLSNTLSSFGLRGSAWIAFGLYFILANPILEELYWRGIYLTRDAVPSSHDFFFAGYHILVLYHFMDWPWLVAAFLGIACVSWLWRILTIKLGGLCIAIATHGVADCAIILSTCHFLAKTSH
jgi:membrane protease YdiL (CAAX protease family)